MRQTRPGGFVYFWGLYLIFQELSQRGYKIPQHVLEGHKFWFSLGFHNGEDAHMKGGWSAASSSKTWTTPGGGASGPPHYLLANCKASHASLHGRSHREGDTPVSSPACRAVEGRRGPTELQGCWAPVPAAMAISGSLRTA